MLSEWNAVMSQLKSHLKAVPVSFGERLATSSKFDRLFSDGMALVEKTAAYLDSQGRTDAKALKGPSSVSYATESMRLTTRLLEIASWLLIRRSLKNGEISTEEAQAKRARLKIGGHGRASHIGQLEALPAGLQTLIEESFHLTDRVLLIERVIEAPKGDAGDPVGDQRSRIEKAFLPRLVVSN